MGGAYQRCAGTKAGKLRNDYRGGDGIKTGPAVFLRNHDAKEAHLGHLGNQFRRKTRRLVARCRSRRNLRLGKIADRLLEEFLLLREIKIHNALRSLRPWPTFGSEFIALATHFFFLAAASLQN